ncbi:Aerobic cobaltochelatase subunit CobN [Candidatus Hodgkinia cicadicola]|uniref:Aerobic cobaltochelatase subunit CobN n=1 Tax=Candidatus Hodgkinia cicadicola TaxID=573658 RepID=A0ABX4MGT0_9HYPH|nr:Aerobic cobaltochelatase subunit CobN [Candidatus Hodgkinia cicadicola]
MEILFCSDKQADLDGVVKLLRISPTSRLINLILINGNYKSLEYFSTSAKLASLVAIRLRQTTKHSLELLKLASTLSTKYKFILTPIIGDVHLQSESYNYANVPNVVIDGLWQCCVLSRTRLLAKHLCNFLDAKNDIEIKDKSKSSEVKIFKLNETPSRTQDNNVLICCYGISENDSFVKQVIQKLILVKQRPIILCNNGQLHSNWLDNCNLIRTRYLPKIELNIVCFCNVPTMKLDKTITMQTAQSEKLLKQISVDLMGLTTSEIVRKVWLPETEGKIFTKAIGISKPNLCLTQPTYNNNKITISNRINSVTSSLINQIGLKSNKRKIVYILANYPPDDSRIGNGVGLDTLESITNINGMLNKNTLNGRSLIEVLIDGVTNKTNLNRSIRATMSLSLANRQHISWVSDVEKNWGPLGLDAFVISGFCTIPALRLGTNMVLIQPTRGYGLTNPSIHHSTFIVPCAFYCLSYLFIKRTNPNTLILNIGKHGNLEWMPGRSIALSRWCYPEWIARFTTNAYLYIVNDPGEGIQAKRRISPTIIDHDIPLVTEYSTIPDWKGTGFSCYSNLGNEYICSLLDLQFKCKLHCWCEFSLHEIIYSTLVLNKWQLSTRSVNLSLNVNQWWKAKHRWMTCSNLTKRAMFMEHSVLQIKDMDVVMRLVSLRLASCYNELNSITKVQHNCFIQPGLASSFTRADDNILPTGRNFYIKNTNEMPTPFAYNISKTVVSKLIRNYYYRSCKWLRSVAINVWATSNMRTGGDDIAIIMNLIGVKPIWHVNSSEVIGFEVLPLTQLQRPRINVLVRVSGLFRDTCPLILTRLYKMFSVVDNLQDSPKDQSQWSGTLFSSKPGSYGVGIQELLDCRNLPSISCLATKYMIYGGYCFNGKTWINAIGKLSQTLTNTQVILQTQDNYEHDILDSDDYYQFEGGLNAAIRHCRGGVCAYHVDTSQSMQRCIKIRKLKYELARVVTCKLLNKNWMLKMLESGYRGAAEILTNLSHFCNFAVTTGQTVDSQFNAIYTLLFQTKDIMLSITKSNPNAYLAMKQKLFEIVCSGTWQAPSNSFRLYLGS